MSIVSGVLSHSHKNCYLFSLYRKFEHVSSRAEGRGKLLRPSCGRSSSTKKTCKKSRLKYSRLEMQQSDDRSDVSVYFMRTKATSADIHSLDLSVNQYANSLDVRFPGSLCFQMGMGYIESRSGSLAANFTIVSHVLHLLALPRLQHSYYITTLFFTQVFYSRVFEEL